MKYRCHTHISCGEDISYIMALRMGGDGAFDFRISAEQRQQKQRESGKKSPELYPVCGKGADRR